MAIEPIIYRVMMHAQRVMFLIGAGFALFLLIPLFIFIAPYHAIRERAEQ